MRRLLVTVLALLGSIAAWGAGTVTQTLVQLNAPAFLAPSSGVWVLTAAWTADSAAATIPSTVLLRTGATLANTDGLYLFAAEIIPGSPSPTAAYTVALTNAAGRDLFAGLCTGLSATLAQVCNTPTGPPLSGALTLAVTGNAVNSAQGQVVLYFTTITPTALVGGIPSASPGGGLAPASVSTAGADGLSNTQQLPASDAGVPLAYRILPLLFNGTTLDRAPGTAAGGAFSQGPAALGSAPVGNPVYIAGRSSGASGTGSIQAIGVCDSNIVLNAGSGVSSVVIAGTAGKRTRVCSLLMADSSAAAASFQFKSGTGTTCGTGTNNLTGVVVTTLQGVPITLGTGLGFVMSTVANGDDLCITTVASTYTGILSYAQF